MDAIGGSFQDYATSVGQALGMPPGLLNWQIGQESGWNPFAQSSTSSAGGLGQFIDSTAKQYGLTDKTDGYASIAAAGTYMMDLFNGNGGDWMKALNSYGTTKDNPSATAAAQQLLGQSGSNQASKSSSCSTLDFGCWYDVLAPRMTAIVLGLIFVFGAFFLWKGR
jgi:hypothetical protein